MDKRYDEARRVTWVSIGVNLGLGIAKTFFGFYGHSQALFADGIHSLSDLTTDSLVLVAMKWGAKQPDEDHPYGHGRIETATAILVALLLAAFGLWIVYDALLSIKQPTHATSLNALVLIVAVVSIISKEWLYRYMKLISERISSHLLHANAWHNRIDALISLVALVGIMGHLIGLRFFDALAAVIVGFFIVKNSTEIIWSSLRELVDTGVDPDVLKAFKQALQAVPGVQAVHELRTRTLGGGIFVDVHVLVDAYISVSEGHFIGDQVRKALLKQFNAVTDVIVHIDPEDDEYKAPSSNLPNRPTLETALMPCWEHLEGYAEIKRIRLHYLSGAVHIEVLWSAHQLNPFNAEALARRQHLYETAACSLGYIVSVKVLVCS